jgi:class 3 adenylate cyclase
MSISITKDRTLEAFAIVVDINDFGQTVTSAEDGSTKGADIADFTRDALEHVIRAIEENEGEVAAVMGDAVFGILPEGAPILSACVEIAVAVNRESEHISEHRVISPADWAYSPGGVSLKICVEFGKMRVTSIKTRYLGVQPLFVGSAINYASRIGAAGEGNRCLLGPAAVGSPEFSSKLLCGPRHVPGKRGEPDLEYYELSLKDRWQERTRNQA